MARIAACYFCGTVLDDPDPHAVGGGLDVDLCGDCARKLDAVLDARDGGRAGADGSETGATPTAESSGLDLDGVAFGESVAPDPETDSGIDAAAEHDGAPGDAGVSRADYQRVVRLLENREFPVARSEIRSVATSAYEMDAETCEAILDAAVERGRVAADGDRLVRPE